MSHNSSFSASAARTLEALPLLVTADEAARILMQLPPQQKVWIALEQVGLPSSATNSTRVASGVSNLAAAAAPPASSSSSSSARQQQQQQQQAAEAQLRPISTTPPNRLRQLAAEQQQQQQQQSQKRQEADETFRRTATAEYVDATNTNANDYEDAGGYIQEMQTQKQQRQETLQQLQPQQQQQRIGAISPPRPLVRSAIGPREHDKSAHLYEEQQEGEMRPVREPWNASPKPTRDDRGCFPHVVNDDHGHQVVDDAFYNDGQQQQQQQDAESNDIGLIDRDIVSRVLRSPHRSGGRGRGGAGYNNEEAADHEQQHRNFGSAGGSVKVVRYDPRSFGGSGGGGGGDGEIVQTPPSSRMVSPPRRTTPQQQQRSGGILMDRLRQTVQQQQQQQRHQDPHHYHHHAAENYQHHQQQQQYGEDQQQEQSQRAPSKSNNNNNHFFAAVPQRNLGQQRGQQAPVQSVERRPSVPVHLNRSLMLRRDSALKRNNNNTSSVNSSSTGGVSPYRSGRSGGGGATTAGGQQYKHVKATVQRPPCAKDVVAPTRPGGSGPFFLSTAQHFPTVSPSRDRDGFGASPMREDRRGRRGIAWIV